MDRKRDELIRGDGMEDDGTASMGTETYDGRFEVVDDFIDSLPFGKGGGFDRRGGNSLEDRKAREEGDENSRESHDVKLLYWFKW